MKKFRLIAAASMAAVVTLLSSGAAQAYPDCGINLTLTTTTLVGGKSFGFKADAGAVDCAWQVDYRGQTKLGNGTSFSGSFATPKVSKKTTTTITATYTFDDAKVSAAPAASVVTSAFYSTGSASNIQAAQRTCPVSVDVTLLPKGADSGASLPNTGGSNLSLLLLGGGLLLVGGGVTYLARRRSSSH